MVEQLWYILYPKIKLMLFVSHSHILGFNTHMWRNKIVKSVLRLGYGLGVLQFVCFWRQEIFYSHKTSGPSLETTQSPVQWVMGLLT